MLDCDDEYPYDYADKQYTDELIEEGKAFLGTAEETSVVPSGWEERLILKKGPQS